MKRRSRPAIYLLLAFFLCGFPAREGAAQVGYTVSSAEWVTVSADQVVRASVRDLQFRDAPPVYPFDKPGEWQWVTVTLAVRETLKGVPGNRTVLTLRRRREDETLRRWRATGRPLLWFLEKHGGGENNFVAPWSAWAPVYPARPNLPAIELGGGENAGRLPAPVFSMDLSLLRTDARLLEAVRSSARANPGEKPEPCGLSVSRALMQETGRSGDANAVMVPVNGQLERLAHVWMAAGEPASKRIEGVSALRHFRTPAHEKLLVGLLDDPETSTVVEYDPDGKLYNWCLHPVREAAYRVLKDWGVPVANPPHRERLEEYVPQ